MFWKSPVLAHPNYRADIDGLRAIAVTFVILGHFFKNVFPGGFIGVDLFFVISGYLIGTIIFKSLQDNQFNFVIFYAKRARRIFPAVMFMLAGALLLGALFLSPAEYSSMGGHAFRGALFVENLRLARGVGYFDLSLAENPMMHLWSLGVEEQFYLIFPLLMWVSWKLVGHKTGLILTLLVLSSFCFGVHHLQESESQAYFWPHARFWELGIGTLLAFCNVRQRLSPVCRVVVETLSRFGTVLSYVAVILLTVFLFLWDGFRVFPGFWALVPVSCAIVLIGAGRDTTVNRFLCHPILVYIGWLSYPLYLWHWMLYSLAYCVFEGNIPIGAKCIVIFVTVLLSAVSLHLVEFPARRKKPTGLLLFKMTALLVFVSLACGAVHKLDGLPSRVDTMPTKVAVLPSAVKAPLKIAKCRYEANAEVDCMCADSKKEAPVFLLGNSHAQHFAAAMQELAPAGFGIDCLATRGTVQVYQMKTGAQSSARRRDQARDWTFEIAASSQSRFVVISSTWFSMPPRIDEKIQLRNNEFVGLDAQFRRTIELFLNRGKRVVLMIDNPMLLHDVETCLRQRPVNLVSAECDLPMNTYLEQSAGARKYFRRLQSLYSGKLYVIDASKGVCGQNVCWFRVDGHTLYHDRTHFTQYGARLYAQEIWRQLMPIIAGH